MEPEVLQLHVLDMLRGSDKVSRIPIIGHSMEPFLRRGDEVEFTHRVDRLRLGDIVLFSPQPGQLVAHRVIARRNASTGPEILEKGDNAAEATWVACAAVHGRVLRVYRGGRVIRLQGGRARLTAWLLAAWSRGTLFIRRRLFRGRTPAGLARLARWVRHLLLLPAGRGKPPPGS